MRRALLCFWVVLVTAGAVSPAWAAIWYVPMTEQISGGFDHIQIRVGEGFELASPAMNNFFAFTSGGGFDPLGSQWGQTFLNTNRNLAVANGPNIGDSMLVFNIWFEGDSLVDRPAFHYQTYRDGILVGNFDLYKTGPGDTDWLVLSGTWQQSTPLPPFTPGDADRDGDVDSHDVLDHWQLNYTGPGGTGATWEDGDWDGDGDVDSHDLLDHWQLNYTGPILGPPPLETRNIVGLMGIPEPMSMAMLGAGLGGLLMRRPRHDGEAR